MTGNKTKLRLFGNAAEAERELAANGPLSWAECLKHLGRSDAEVMHRIANGRVSKAVVLGGRPTMIEVAAIEGGGVDADEARVRAETAAGGSACRERFGPDENPRPFCETARRDARLAPAVAAHAKPSGSAALRIGFPHGGETPELRAAAADYVREWFGLDDDLRPFYGMARRDALLAPAVAAHAGLRLIGIPDLFEALVWSIIGQQITLGFAYAMKKRLVETYGEALPFETAPGEAPYRLFPRPERLAALTPDDLRPLQFSGRKAEYVIGIARMMEEGRLSKSSLAETSEEEAREALLAIRGVGAWTADYVGMKCLRRASAFPATDAGLHQALRSGLNLGRKPLPAEIVQAAAPWRGHEAYAVFYLWQTLLKTN
ncbi:DNA-3-methyladenine glycosylase [Saccharibacillus sp. O23]|uniref:DNA-3-methyladenine glycosylase 2 n=1 Tax=Saccharibacillus sp. O23 TaxID=2009338 RepID=UPI000B4E6166|nr:DNA-3-methyladenine glycosylase 2 [Saccharibacillus sp. O23]OWR30010.1 DNA-3-methyladenine glycosylase [Saccharibacillus sp. O23]